MDAGGGRKRGVTHNLKKSLTGRGVKSAMFGPPRKSVEEYERPEKVRWA